MTRVLPFLIGFGPIPLVVAWADKPEAKPDKALEEVCRAVKRSTVHAVGVSSPARCSIDPEEIGPKWVRLAEMLRDRKGAVAAVWRGLFEPAQEVLSKENVVADLSGEDLSKSVLITAAVCAGLNRTLSKPDLFAEADLKELAVDKDMMKLVRAGEARGQVQTLRLNRALLSLATGGLIPEITDDFQTVKVRVRAGNPVVLALSSSSPCRWVVTVDKGGEVAGVLLCGNGTQELVGVTAPTAYRARYDPRGAARPEAEEAICWKSNEDEAFRKAVSGLLGKDPETLWTRYTPPAGETLDVLPPR